MGVVPDELCMAEWECKFCGVKGKIKQVDDRWQCQQCKNYMEDIALEEIVEYDENLRGKGATTRKKKIKRDYIWNTLPTYLLELHSALCIQIRQLTTSLACNDALKIVIPRLFKIFVRQIIHMHETQTRLTAPLFIPIVTTAGNLAIPHFWTTIALCYIGCLFLRESLLITDFVHWVKTKRLFLYDWTPRGFWSWSPTPFYITPYYLQRIVVHILYFPAINGSLEKLKWSESPLNFDGIAARMLAAFQVPELTPYVIELKSCLPYSSYGLTNILGDILNPTPPRAWIISVIVVAIKLFYRFDGDFEEPLVPGLPLKSVVLDPSYSLTPEQNDNFFAKNPSKLPAPELLNYLQILQSHLALCKRPSTLVKSRNFRLHH